MAHHHLRLEHLGFRGWVVRITRQNRNVCAEYFSDRRYGGRRASLDRALRYRNRRLRVLPPVLAKRRDVRNTTGMVGVHQVWRRGRGGRLCYYVGSWVWPRRSRHQVRKTFSVQKYGKRKARELAMEARRAALKRPADQERRLLLEGLKQESGLYPSSGLGATGIALASARKS